MTEAATLCDGGCNPISGELEREELRGWVIREDARFREGMETRQALLTRQLVEVGSLREGLLDEVRYHQVLPYPVLATVSVWYECGWGCSMQYATTYHTTILAVATPTTATLTTATLTTATLTTATLATATLTTATLATATLATATLATATRTLTRCARRRARISSSSWGMPRRRPTCSSGA